MSDSVESKIPLDPQSKSAAFRQAQLKSASSRIVVVVAAVLAILLLQAVRVLVLHAHEDRTHLVTKVVLVAAFVLYEILMLHAIKRALREGKDLPGFVWILDILIETSLPDVHLHLPARPPDCHWEEAASIAGPNHPRTLRYSGSGNL